MQHEVLALVVVYGDRTTRVTSIQTLAQALVDSVKVRVLIWDNSPKALNVESSFLDRFDHVAYVSTPDNLGLSAIYNEVIEGHLRVNEYLLILDQDSLIPFDFLKVFSQQANQYPDIDLFLPMVRANGWYVSPLPYFYGWGRYWKSPPKGIQSSRFRSAINSGMIISGRYLSGDFKGYDERLRFYGTDTQFMILYAENRKHFIIMEVVLEHDLSFFSATNESKLSKFQEMKRAYHWIYENQPLYRRIINSFVMSVVSIAYAFKYKSISFFRSE